MGLNSFLEVAPYWSTVWQQLGLLAKSLERSSSISLKSKSNFFYVFIPYLYLCPGSLRLHMLLHGSLLFYSCSLLQSTSSNSSNQREIELHSRSSIYTIKKNKCFEQCTLPPFSLFLGVNNTQCYTTFPAPACSEYGRTPCTPLMHASEQFSETQKYLLWMPH